MNKRLVWAGLLSSALVMPVIGAVAVASPSEKVRICHATGSQSNPYTSNNVNTSSVDERNNRYLNGHGDHAMDIIPPFESPEGTAFPGQNWAEGQGIWNNGCKVVVPTPTPTATPTETSTPTETPTPTGSATPEGSETPTPTETPSETPSVTPTATPTETPTPSITPTPRETTPPPTKKPTPSVTPTPTETPKASVTPTPRRTTAPPSATPSKTPRKTTPPVVVTPPPPATPDLPTCEQVADEQAGKTYAKDSPEAAGIPCR